MINERETRFNEILTKMSKFCIAVPAIQGNSFAGFNTVDFKSEKLLKEAYLIDIDVLSDAKKGVKTDETKSLCRNLGHPNPDCYPDFDEDYVYYDINPEHLMGVKELFDKLSDKTYMDGESPNEQHDVDVLLDYLEESAKEDGLGILIERATLNPKNLFSGSVVDPFFNPEAVTADSIRVASSNSIYCESNPEEWREIVHAQNALHITFDTPNVAYERVKGAPPILLKNDKYFSNYFKNTHGSAVYNISIAVPKNEDNSLNYEEAIFINDSETGSFSDDSPVRDFILKHGEDNVVFKAIQPEMYAAIGKYVYNMNVPDYIKLSAMSNHGFASSGDYVKDGIMQKLSKRFNLPEQPDDLKINVSDAKSMEKWFGVPEVNMNCHDFQCFIPLDSALMLTKPAETFHASMSKLGFTENAAHESKKTERTKSSDRIYGTGKRGDEFVESGNEYQSEQSMSY